jgi:Flp pilus assembly protein TadB
LILDRSSLSYLHALRGLVAVGESLPSALFRLATSVPAPFAVTLQSFLGSFDGGRPLRECLQRFRERSELRVTGTCLAMLEMAYRQGLSVGPLLDRLLPVLESEHAHRERIRELRRATFAQLAIAAAIPLVLGCTLHLFQPETLTHFAGSPLFRPVLFLVFIFESLGAWVIWKVSNFY